MNSIPVGFFGLTVEPSKTYSQTVEDGIKLTMATLTAKLPKDAARTSVTLLINDKEFTLCSLLPNVHENQALDITLNEGEEITFKVVGNCSVDLTGHHFFVDFDDEEDEELDSELEGSLEGLEEEDDMESIDEEEMQMLMNASDEESDEEEEMDEELLAEIMGKRKAKPVPTSKEAAAKKAKLVEIVEQEEEESEEEEMEEESEEEEEPAPVPEPKKQKKQNNKENASQKTEPKQQQQQQKTNKKTLPSGLVIEDTKVGNGPKAKSGKRVGVRYIGRLSNGKVFDSNTSGKPFYFKLGKGEVIKGWDVGVQDMAVGGSRKLTIPANLAYGAKGAKPDIPPNATLTFEIKLLEVK